MVGNGKTTSTSNAERNVTRKNCELDFDTLECPVCLDRFSPPVFQCENGHTVCGACCKKLKKGCPSCSKATGRIRNLTVEKILESIIVGCKYAEQGCQEMVKCSKQKEHEERLCKYRSFQCPLPDCIHKCVKSALPLHFKEEHMRELTPVVVRESVQTAVNVSFFQPYVMLQDGDRLFLVHREYDKSLGHIFFCTSFETSTRICQLGVEIGAGDKYCKRYTMDCLVHDNQREEGSVVQVKDRKDFLIVPVDSRQLFSSVRVYVTISPEPVLNSE